MMFWKCWIRGEEGPEKTAIADSHKAAYERALALLEAAGDRIEQLEDERSDIRVAHAQQVAELERKVADLQSGAAIGDQLIVFYKTEIASLEKQVAELTAERDEVAAKYNNILDEICGIVVDHACEEDEEDDEPETDEPAESVSEQTQVFDSRQYGEQQ